MAGTFRTFACDAATNYGGNNIQFRFAPRSFVCADGDFKLD